MYVVQVWLYLLPWPQLKSRQLGFCLQTKHEDWQFNPSKKCWIDWVTMRLTDSWIVDSWIVVNWIVDNWIVDEEAFHKKRKWLCQAVLCNGLNWKKHKKLILKFFLANDNKRVMSTFNLVGIMVQIF